MNAMIKGAAFCSTLGLLTLASCEDTVDCFNICNRFSECVTNIDVSECTDQCEDRVEADAAIEERADVCEDCVEDGACGEIVGCFDNCPVVVVPD
jgi:hypothetical protein